MATSLLYDNPQTNDIGFARAQAASEESNIKHKKPCTGPAEGPEGYGKNTRNDAECGEKHFCFDPDIKNVHAA